MPEATATAAPTKSPYDLQRQRITADAAAAEAAKKAAVERQLTNKGIGDSGILLGQTRRAEQDVRVGAARERGQVDINEGLSEESRREAALNRALQEKQFGQADETTRRGQDISKDLGQGSLALQERGVNLSEKSQADSLELAKQGLNLDQTRVYLQEKGMSQQDAQYYAGLSQANALAQRGLDQNAVQIELQKQGMTQQDAQYYAGLRQQETQFGQSLQEQQTARNQQNAQFNASLTQAKELALAGLDLQGQSLALQEKGMSQQDAQFYAGLSQADQHAQQGFTLQESAQNLQEQGMGQQNAQFYAGLSQSRYLAEQGFDIQTAAQELQRQGMAQEQAQFYAGLSQAKYLAEKGLDQNAVAQELQAKGMDQQQAQFQANMAFNYTQLAQQKDLTQSGITSDIQKGVLVDQMSRIATSDPAYGSKMYDLLNSFGLAAGVYPDGRPATQSSTGAQADTLVTQQPTGVRPGETRDIYQESATGKRYYMNGTQKVYV